MAGAGFGPGRGPEAGADEGVPAEGASDAAGRGAGAPGLGPAGRAGDAGVGEPPARLAAAGEGADLRGAPGLAPDLPAFPPGPCSASVNLRTTGASIVEDAERTNSPSSWSLAMTTLLSTPNSLASSYTRTLATSLLLGPGYRRTVATSWAYSSRTHRVLIAISTYFQLARYLTARGSVPYFFLRCRLVCCCSLCLLDVPPQCGGVERSLRPEGPGERPASYSQVETDRGGVYIRTPAGQRTAIIGDTFALDHHDAQQIALGRPLPAPHTGAFRACAVRRPTRHVQVYLPVATSPLWGKNRTIVVSISARHPVSATTSRPVAFLSPGRDRDRRSARCRDGCRCASRSAGRRDERSVPLCRSPVTAGSRERSPGRSVRRGRRPPPC